MMVKSYMRDRAKPIILCLIIVALFTASYFLFNLPAIATVYPLIMSLAAIVIVGAFDYAAYVRRHKQLVTGDIPEAAGLLEADYRKIIKSLKEEEQFAKQKASEEYDNMAEYYTVWAHQIKTPIAAMRLNLQSETLQADSPEMARRLSGDLARIESYVEMVLTFLRLDSESTDYLIKEYDLDEIIKSSVRKFSREFILKKLSMDYEPTGYRVLSDEKWLTFVIEQVISNAVKYTNEGGVKITMEEPGILKISDTGIGISAEDLPRIFENGFTGFAGREDKRASGIGLYLCKRIMDNLGHEITAESEPGTGTTIIMDLRMRNLEID